MGKKSGKKKRRLTKAARKNKRIPALAMIRTNRRVSSNRYRRPWRTEKLRIKEEE